MVLCLKVPKKDAERARQLLAANGWLTSQYSICRVEEHVLLPILPSVREQVKALGLGPLAEMFMPPLGRKPLSISEVLADHLSEEEREVLVGAFDIVGDIAVLEIPPSLQPKRAAIAQAVLSVHPQVKVVAQKTGGTGGPFRIRPIEVIVGEKRTLTICKESGCSFAIDLNAAYYTPRWSAERLRLAAQVLDGEKVLVCFAGVGPYAVVIEKHSRPAAIAAIELNPAAALLLRRNIALNHCQKIEPIEGDVKAVLSAPRWKGWADRALMPHPTEAEKFLPAVLPALRAGGMLHYYCFAPTVDPVETAFARVQTIVRSLGWKAKLAGGRVVRPYSPSLVQVVLDLEVHRAGTQGPKKKPAAPKPPARKRLAKARAKKKAPAKKERATSKRS